MDALLEFTRQNNKRISIRFSTIVCVEEYEDLSGTGCSRITLLTGGHVLVTEPYDDIIQTLSYVESYTRQGEVHTPNLVDVDTAE